MRPKELPSYLRVGKDVHAILEGKRVRSQNVQVDLHVVRLLEFWKLHGFRLAGTKAKAIEVLQEVPIGKDIRIVRKLDRLAIDEEGTPVLVDWKTASSQWESLIGHSDIVPKSLTFQTACYLIPPEDIAPYKKAWPTELDFIVSTHESMHARCYSTWRDRQAEKEFIEAAQVVAKATTFPRIRGWNCKWCIYASACYETKDWQDEYLINMDDRGVPEAYGDDE